MAGKVQLQPSGKTFYLDGDDSVLEAALRYGVPLDYGCSNGNCGHCKARLVKGEIEKITRPEFVFGEAEKAQGYFLMCSNTARGDILIEATEAHDVADIPLQHVPARVKKLTSLTDQILLLHLQTPRTKRLRFLAGQNARLKVDDCSDAYPIASCPCDDRNIEFHIQVSQDDDFTQLVAQLEANNIVNIEGPVGNFILDEDSQRPIIFIAFDTGFAPIKSLIEHAMQLERSEFLHLYWIACGKGDHYMHNLARSWTDAFDNFTYTPLKVAPPSDSDANIADHKDDTLQHTLQQLERDHQALSKYDFYIAGPDTVVQTVSEYFAQRGVPNAQIHAAAIH